MNSKFPLLVLSLVFTSRLVAAVPSIIGLEARQNWPFSDAVDVAFSLSAGERCDVVLSATWDGQSNPVELKTMYNVAASSDCQVRISPADYGIGTAVRNFRVSAEAYALSDRMYLVLDLPTRTKSYLAESAVGADTFATTEYRTTKMAFRRVLSHKASGEQVTYVSGYNTDVMNIDLPQHDGTTVKLSSRNRTRRSEVKFSCDYFIAVMPMTIAHRKRLGSSYETSVEEGVEGCTYNTMRGKLTEGINFPETGFKVSGSSWLAAFRKNFRACLPACFFDLPTCTQLRIAHKAGEGDDHIFSLCPELKAEGYSPITVGMEKSDMLALVGKIAVWSGNSSTFARPSIPAQCSPNAWYLFDSSGGAYPQCLIDANVNNNGGEDVYGANTAASDADNRQCMGGNSGTSCNPILGLVPCEYYGLAQNSNGMMRLVINTEDWLGKGF